MSGMANEQNAQDQGFFARAGEAASDVAGGYVEGVQGFGGDVADGENPVTAYGEAASTAFDGVSEGVQDLRGK